MKLKGIVYGDCHGLSIHDGQGRRLQNSGALKVVNTRMVSVNDDSQDISG